MTASYSLTYDKSGNADDIGQIGDFGGDYESQKIESEFNFLRNKLTILYSHRFNNSFSLYSIYIKYSVIYALNLNLKYIFRMNRSNIDTDDYYDHIFLLGMEYDF
ncbi:MAG: hypothetical protein ABIA04_11415 [Pseudomonadota bacterium]